MKTTFTKQSAEYAQMMLDGCKLACERFLDKCDYDNANIKCAQIHWWEWELSRRLGLPVGEYQRPKW